MALTRGAPRLSQPVQHGFVVSRSRVYSFCACACLTGGAQCSYGVDTRARRHCQVGLRALLCSVGSPGTQRWRTAPILKGKRRGEGSAGLSEKVGSKTDHLRSGNNSAYRPLYDYYWHRSRSSISSDRLNNLVTCTFLCNYWYAMASIFVRDRLNTIADVVEDDRGRTLIALDPWQEQVQAAQAGLEVDFEQLSLDNGRAARSRTSVHKYSKFVVSFTPGSRYI